MTVLKTLIQTHLYRIRVPKILKKRTDLVKLENDAADAPDVTGLAPAQLQDHLGRAVVPRRHHRRVVLPVERGRAKVDQLDPGVLHAAHGALRGGADVGVPVRAHKQDVLRLQVRVGQVVVVQELEQKS